MGLPTAATTAATGEFNLSFLFLRKYGKSRWVSYCLQWFNIFFSIQQQQPQLQQQQHHQHHQQHHPHHHPQTSQPEFSPQQFGGGGGGGGGQYNQVLGLISSYNLFYAKSILEIIFKNHIVPRYWKLFHCVQYGNRVIIAVIWVVGSLNEHQKKKGSRWFWRKFGSEINF